MQAPGCQPDGDAITQHPVCGHPCRDLPPPRPSPGKWWPGSAMAHSAVQIPAKDHTWVLQLPGQLSGLRSGGRGRVMWGQRPGGKAQLAASWETSSGFFHPLGATSHPSSRLALPLCQGQVKAPCPCSPPHGTPSHPTTHQPSSAVPITAPHSPAPPPNIPSAPYPPQPWSQPDPPSPASVPPALGRPGRLELFQVQNGTWGAGGTWHTQSLEGDRSAGLEAQPLV